MLPDIRAVIAAMVAAIGLLLISFALVATYRVAQQTGSLQADLAKRGRTALPALSGERQVPIIETPGPHLAVPVEAAKPTATVPPAETVSAPPVSEPEPLPVAAAPPPIESPSAVPPVGGPHAAPPESSRNAAAENPSRIDSRRWQRAAAEKARKARAARIARERKAALRHAAQARRAKQSAAPASNSFGSPFGGTFTRPAGQ